MAAATTAAVTTKGVEPDSSNRQVDEDWLARFIDYAQDIGSEHVQQWWARILAGEVSCPGTFSMHALDRLRIMGMEDAKAFSEWCRRAWKPEGILPLMILTPSAKKKLTESNFAFAQSLRLVSLGLIREQASFDTNDDLKVWYFGSEYEFRKLKGTSVTVATYPGSELASIVVAEPDLDYRDSVLTDLASRGCYSPPTDPASESAETPTA